MGRRKEETWLVLEQLEYSWERGHVHRERLKQAISGPAPLSPRSHTIMHHPHPSLSPLIHLSPPQQGPVVQFPSRLFFSLFFFFVEFMVACLTLTDGRREVGGSLRLSHHGEDLQKKMAAPVVVP